MAVVSGGGGGGGSGAAAVYAQVSRSVDISAWDGNALPFNTVDYDPGGLWDSVNHQFVAAVAGFYAVRVWATTNSGMVDYVASGAGSNSLNAVVNGAGANVDLVVSTPVAGAVYFPPLVGVVSLAIGDGLEIDGGGGASWTVHHGITFAIQLIAAA